MALSNRQGTVRQPHFSNHPTFRWLW